ncbi:MAG: hypothetical protein PHC50_06210 [Candidatus Cloacimonetes bacterium]|nr:hypothetical protein [Candidatus Cloacimonadota bacterium]
MAVKFYDKVLIRSAGAVFSSIAKSELVSWDLMPSGAKVTQELNMTTEPDVTTPLGDGTDEVGSEAANCEMQLIGWQPAALPTLRSALINKKVDILVYDSRNDATAWAIFGTQVYPHPEIAGGKEEVIKLTGKVRYASDLNPAMVPVSLT